MAAEDEHFFNTIHQYLVSQSRRGEKMDTENMLAKRFQVSRYRIRQVLDQLSQMGVLERAQKRGMSLTEVKPDVLARNVYNQLAVNCFDVREYLEARLSLMEGTIGLSVTRMTPVLLSRLDQTVQQLQGCIEVHAAALKLHSAFQRTLIEASGNRVIQVLAYALLENWYNLLETSTLDTAFFSTALDSDRAILKAVKVGDSEEAKKLLTSLLRSEMLYLISH
ncbi:MAG: FCD domain-containing protein [Sutterellaceae bacterium]|nr:FCD domain-containing protein [Sutterellaceae bacterium]MDD7441386.1 FCD domain-containing protein [Sutterellaceae bacterium]MDY2867488.1 FCD domain-containing protein [Mesosutterella sp.]